MKTMLLFFVTAAILFACAPKNTQVITEEVTEEITINPVDEGKMLFQQKCGKCHDLPTVDSYSQEQWSNILPQMGVKAKLTESEYAQVDAYVQFELEN